MALLENLQREDSALTCTKREGNILTTIIRSARDTGTLEPITKNSRIKATGAHIGICTHITKTELDKKMSETEAFNGFANRFLWCCARRSKLVALPPPMPADMLSKARNALLGLISKVLDIEEMRFNGYAREHYENVYPKLTKARGGLVGAITDRAEAQVIRLCMIYALLDGKEYIEPEHLEAALAFWQYCEDSARFIFLIRKPTLMKEKFWLRSKRVQKPRQRFIRSLAGS